MAQSLFELSKEQFGSTRYNYVKASFSGATDTIAVQVAATAGAAAGFAKGGIFGAISGGLTATKEVQAKLLQKSGTSSLINVCDDFDWTISPLNNVGFNKRLIPRGLVKEYRVEDTAILAALLYAGQAAQETATATVDDVANILKKVGADDLASLATGTGNVVEGAVKSINTKSAEFSNINQNLDFPTSDWMQPYKNLYSLKATDFKYLFPYLDNSAFSELRNSWPDLTFPLSPTLYEQFDRVSNFAKFTAPGQYIEKPKMYNPADSGAPSVTFKFPLFNSQKYESACRNYQLLWLLVFQNTPQRVTKSLLEMPKIYAVTVPGVCYMQYSFVESLAVDFLGNRRHVDITMPKTSIGLPTNIPAIMPDAYEVTITFRSLNIHNSNMLLEMWKNSTPQTVSF